jgi:hypothetical protein
MTQEQSIAPLDQSKEDLNLRASCLSVAISIAATPNGHPEDTIDYAREFYLFLSGKDPVLDCEGPLPDNVISMKDYIESKRGSSVATTVDQDDVS